MTRRGATGYDSFRILSRSRHLPVALTEGSLTETSNKTGVRLWTDCSHLSRNVFVLRRSQMKIRDSEALLLLARHLH